MKRRYWILALAAVMFLLVACRIPILQLVGHLLVVDDPCPPEADFLVIMMGDPISRVPYAAELYHQKCAAKIVFARPQDTGLAALKIVPNEAELTRQMLVQLKVPERAILVPHSPPVTSTAEEGRFMVDFLQHHQPPVKSIVLVTSWHHSSRARWVFKKFAAGTSLMINMKAAPHPDHTQDNWWKNEDGMIAVFSEYIKWLYYLKNFLF